MDGIVLELIEREMEYLKTSKNECKDKLSRCALYSQYYWKLHDQYEAYVIKIGYLAELRDKIRKVMILCEEFYGKD